MSDTPRTDFYIGDENDYIMTEGEKAMCNFARQLERELNDANAALSGRTVSCSNCNALAAENAAMREAIKSIYDDTEGYADGAPDATAHDKLCNEISSKLKPYLK